MAYITSSLTSANPAADLYTAMATALTTAGYTLVDTVVISTRTHKVWKSAAAGNSLNLDWYLDVNYPTTGVTGGLGGFSMQPFEYYDPATDLGYRGCLGAAAAGVATIDATTFSRYGATGYALETNWIGGSAQTAYQISMVTSAFTYYISATPDRVIVLLSNSPSVIMTAGFYVPDSAYATKAGAGLYPLVGMRMVVSSSASTSTTATSIGLGLTRIAPVTAFTTSNWTSSGQASPQDTSNMPPLAAGDTTLYPFAALPLDLRTNGCVPSGRFGTIRDILSMAGNTVARGDTVTIAGATWVCTSANGSQALLFKAA